MKHLIIAVALIGVIGCSTNDGEEVKEDKGVKEVIKNINTPISPKTKNEKLRPPSIPQL